MLGVGADSQPKGLSMQRMCWALRAFCAAATRAVPTARWTHRVVSRLSLVLVVAVSALGMSALGLLVSASVASADTTTEDFTTQGCSVITPPSPGPGATPYNTVSIQATGAAGDSGNNGDSNAAGHGGYVTGTIVGVSGQLDVCVNVGFGADPNGTGGYNGGGGGGASGVSASAATSPLPC
jgi:hypothetical protein